MGEVVSTETQLLTSIKKCDQKYQVFLFHLSSTIMAQQSSSPSGPITVENKATVKLFLEQVRSGKQPENAVSFMADTVLAHQMNAEEQTTVKRTPQNYTDHINEFLKMYGNFSFEITELMADGDKVYTRWKQTGKHLAEIDGYEPTGKPLTEIASCVYRLESGKIIEYWIQIDRLGFEKQLQHSR